MANIQPFGGFGPFGGGLFGSVDRWPGTLFRSMFGGTMTGSFPIDIRDEGDKYVVEADMPGLHREMIHVDIQDGVLTISTDMDQETQTEGEDYVVHERRSGTMSRSFSVQDVNEDAVTASYTDGVLKVTLPKGKDDDKQKKIINID